MSIPKNLIKLTIFIALVTSMTGCFQLHQRIVIECDGSAQISYHYAVKEEDKPFLKKLRRRIEIWQGREAKEPLSQMHWFFNEEEARNFFAGQGIHLISYRKYTEAQKTHVEVMCKIENLPKALETGKFGDLMLRKELGNKYKLSGLQNTADVTYPDEQSREKNADLMAHLTDGLDLRLKIQVPGKIHETNATEIKDGEAIWRFEFDGDEKDIGFKPEGVELTFEAEALEI